MTALLHTVKSASGQKNTCAELLFESSIIVSLHEQVELTMDSWEFLG